MESAYVCICIHAKSIVCMCPKLDLFLQTCSSRHVNTCTRMCISQLLGQAPAHWGELETAQLTAATQTSTPGL